MVRECNGIKRRQLLNDIFNFINHNKYCFSLDIFNQLEIKLMSLWIANEQSYKICKFWQRDGHCPNRARCRYQHFTLVKHDQKCHFHQHSACNRGKNCYYLHSHNDKPFNFDHKFNSSSELPPIPQSILTINQHWIDSIDNHNNSHTSNHTLHTKNNDYCCISSNCRNDNIRNIKNSQTTTVSTSVLEPTSPNIHVCTSKTSQSMETNKTSTINRDNENKDFAAISNMINNDVVITKTNQETENSETRALFAKDSILDVSKENSDHVLSPTTNNTTKSNTTTHKAMETRLSPQVSIIETNSAEDAIKNININKLKSPSITSQVSNTPTVIKNGNSIFNENSVITNTTPTTSRISNITINNNHKLNENIIETSANISKLSNTQLMNNINMINTTNNIDNYCVMETQDDIDLEVSSVSTVSTTNSSNTDDDSENVFYSFQNKYEEAMKLMNDQLYGDAWDVLSEPLKNKKFTVGLRNHPILAESHLIRAHICQSAGKYQDGLICLEGINKSVKLSQDLQIRVDATRNRLHRLLQSEARPQERYYYSKF